MQIIEVEHLSKTFGDFKAVDGISFGVKKGEIFGFLGANGAGKTTAMRLLIGLLKPTSGMAKVAGFDIFTETESIKKVIGYMSQKFSLYDDLSIQENIDFFGGIYGLHGEALAKAKNNLLKTLNIASQKDKLVRDIPLGWKQKLAFSVAILHQPQVVFLDEPTGGVDPLTRRQFWDLINQAAEEGITVFVTTHYMDEAEYCHRISIMVDGRIAALGTPKELKEQFKTHSIDEVFYQLARSAKRSAD